MIVVLDSVATATESLRKIRRSRDITHVQLASLMKCSSSQISEWERGRVIPRAEVLISWAAALDCVLALLPEES